MKLLCFCTFFSLALATPLPPFKRSGIIEFQAEDFKNVLPRGKTMELGTEQIRKLRMSLKNFDLNATDILTAQINEYMDKFIGYADEMLRKNNYDPVSLPNIHDEMSADIFWLIPYTGTFDMNGGSLSGPSTIYRIGDAIVSYNESSKFLSLNVPISFKKLQFSYHFKVSFPLLYYTSGTAKGGVPDLDMNVAVGVNFDTGLISLDDYAITNSGHISISFYTWGFLPNWTLNLMMDACTAMLKDSILTKMQSEVKDILTKIIDILNMIIRSILDS